MSICDGARRKMVSDKYKRSNRRVHPTMNNPYSNMIWNYIKGNTAPMPLNLQQTGWREVDDPHFTWLEKQIEQQRKAYEYYQSVGNEGKYELHREMYNNLVATYEKEKGNVIGVRPEYDKTGQYRQIPEYDREHGHIDGYEYEEAEYDPNKRARSKYDTLDWNDYDVYMAYYRSMGFYIPNGWKIDYDGTKELWRTHERTWKWRKLLLYFTGNEMYQEMQYIPFFVGQMIRSTDYITGQKRGWFMLKTLAFKETVSTALMRNMKEAIRKKPFNENEHFRIEKYGWGSQETYNIYREVVTGLSDLPEHAYKFLKDPTGFVEKFVGNLREEEED